jgi:hypothetical protein
LLVQREDSLEMARKMDMVRKIEMVREMEEMYSGWKWSDGAGTITLFLQARQAT